MLCALLFGQAATAEEPLGDVTTPIDDPRVFCETRCVEWQPYLPTEQLCAEGVCWPRPDAREPICLKRVRFCGEVVTP